MGNGVTVNRRHYKMDKQRVLILFLIAVVSASIAVGGAFSINTITRDNQEKAIKSLCGEQKIIKEKIIKIETGNVNRDKNDVDTKEFMKGFREWQLKDAEWKGKLGEAVNQSMYYGESGKLGDLLKISDENKRAISKKNIVE